MITEGGLFSQESAKDKKARGRGGGGESVDAQPPPRFCVVRASGAEGGGRFFMPTAADELLCLLEDERADCGTEIRDLQS